MGNQRTSTLLKGSFLFQTHICILWGGRGVLAIFWGPETVSKRQERDGGQGGSFERTSNAIPSRLQGILTLAMRRNDAIGNPTVPCMLSQKKAGTKAKATLLSTGTTRFPWSSFFLRSWS